ncbi:MAG: GTPase Era [Acidiferrobacterales bacterium]|nr:GTPase Era [Acidiferrobacterales bacterium]
MEDKFRFGFVTIVGRPNVGKSTLMNQIIGQKISITSHRPQTTRHRILGIHTDSEKQIVFVDTPGIHSLAKKSNRKAMNKIINRTAIASIEGVDLIFFMITAKAGWTDEDKLVLSSLKDVKTPVILVINKIDLLPSINQLLPLIEGSSSIYDFVEIVPISALGRGKENNVEHLTEVVTQYLPVESAGFDEDQITDRSFRFLVSELVREQLFRRLGDELPYATAVELNTFKLENDVYHIGADIWVEKNSHKAMVIGKKGEALKNIGEAARKNCESLLEKKVFLELWVKVRSGWSDNARDLYSLGYDEDIG